MTQNDADELATQFYHALTSGDTATCGRLFGGDAVVWHNYDLAEKSPAEALAPVAAMSAYAPRFELVERVMVPGGWVQQHRFHFLFPDGDTRVLAALQRVHIRDGLIVRVDEYMDTAQLGAIIQKAQSSSST
jgi:ketosteroid isomerase-like protein